MRLLIIGSLRGQFSAAGKIAIDRGAKLSHAEDIESAMRALRGGQGADLAMIDVALDVAELVARLVNERISLPVVACGLGTDANAAVKAIKAGAKEYIPLPPDPDMIAAVLEAVAEDNDAMIFQDPCMHEVVRLTDRVAASNASILITGESGTGKEVLARYLISKSNRSAQPFVSVNCAAIPDNLLESELFGHEKGAFTGAVARRIGKFEEADGGTLLLDEISEMDTRLQAKLLRVIQERVIDRVGGTKPVGVDIRVIATSNRDLDEAVRNGSFREDLLFRLNVVNLKLPPLRERPGDIALLSEHFVAKYSELNALELRRLSAAAIDLLCRSPWPGNVRELENTMHRAVLLASGEEIDRDAIRRPDGSRPDAPAMPAPSSAATAESGGSAQHGTMVGQTVAEVEQQLILQTLNHCLGNRTHAATILGISIRTLRNKLKQYSTEGANVPTPGEGQRLAV